MSTYQEAILNARKEFLKLSSSQEKELLKLYIELASQLKIDISKCRTSSQERYLKNLHGIVEGNIRDLDKELNKMVKDSIEASSQIASSVDLAYYEAITEDARLSAMFKSIALNNSRKTVSKLIQGDFYKDKRSLDARLWSVSDKSIKDVDTLIKINVLKGANARELAKEVEKYVNPAKRLTIKQDYVGFNKNISYQSARLARTSITHSFAETTIENSKTNPFNKGIKWNLSASHFSRMHGKRDICDDYAGRVFKPNEVPLQHPNCLCYLTEENTDIDQAIKELKAWTKGGSNPKLDTWLDKHSKDLQVTSSARERANIFSESVVSKKEINNKVKVNLQLFRLDEKKELEKLISSGVINRDEYNECYNYFKEYFEGGINTPLGMVYDKGDRYIHIAYRHNNMVSREEINNIVKSLEDPDTIYKTKDKFGSEGNGYVKKINENELLTIVKDGIITSYYPTKNYINNNVKRGEIIWEKR